MAGMGGSDVMPDVTLRQHDIRAEPRKFGSKEGKCHVVAAALLLLYTHDSSGHPGSIFRSV